MTVHKKAKVFFQLNNVLKLRSYIDFLFTIINYCWTQMLKEFNDSSRIPRKVQAIDQDNVKRRALGKVHKHLDLMFEDGSRKCFYCGGIISDANLSVNYVIPWSYMFSDNHTLLRTFLES